MVLAPFEVEKLRELVVRVVPLFASSSWVAPAGFVRNETSLLSAYDFKSLITTKLSLSHDRALVT